QGLKAWAAGMGRRQVIVMTTAAAAATRMAIAAGSTEMEGASVVVSQSRRALEGPRWGGTVGIAGRACMECPPQHTRAGNAYGRLRALERSPSSAAAARNAAISMMKEVANQSSSGESIDMGSRTGRSRKRT